MRKSVFYILPIPSAIAVSFTIGYLLDEIYLSWFFIIPAINLFYLMLPKPPLVSAGSNCKYVIAVYITSEYPDDIKSSVDSIAKLKSLNPSGNAGIALITEGDEDISANAKELYRLVSDRINGNISLLIGRNSYGTDRISPLFDLSKAIGGDTSKFSAVYGREYLSGCKYIYYISPDFKGRLTMDFATESTGKKEIVLPCNHSEYRGVGMFCVSELRKYAGIIANANPLCKERLLCAYLGVVRAEGVRVISDRDNTFSGYFDRYIKAVKKSVMEIITLPLCRMPLSIAFREAANSLYQLTAVLTPCATVALALAGYLFYPPAVSKGITVCLLLYLLAEGIKNRSARESAYDILMLPTTAITNLYTFIRESVAPIFGQGKSVDTEITDLGYSAISSVMGILLFPSKSGAVKILSLIALFMPIYMLIEGLPKKEKAEISYKCKKYLTEQVKIMWQYFDENIGIKTNYLPPRYIQYSPDITVQSTLPSDIGLYMLCCLAVCDIKLITPSDLYERLDMTLNAVGKLETDSHIRLYKEYSTETLEVTDKSIDDNETGLYLICLISLCEGIKEYVQVFPKLSEISCRLECIISETDLSEVCNTYAIGNGVFSSLLAVSKRNKPKEHWYKLTRVKVSHGFYEGYLSQFGSAAEYYTLRQFLDIPKESEIDLSCKFCLHAQKEYAKQNGSTYGISRAASGEFDDSLVRVQKDFGVKRLGINEPICENTVSPYSAYLMLCGDTAQGLENIKKFESLGMSGCYGLYDSYSYKSKQVNTIYSAEHIGLSIISCANVISGGSFIKRTSRHGLIESASELLAYKPTKEDTETCENNCECKKAFTKADILHPCIRIYSQDGYSVIASSNGDISSLYKGRVIFPIDSGFNKCGLYFSFWEKELTPISYSFGYSAEYEYLLDKILLRQKVYIQNGLPCEIREFVFTNTSGSDISGKLCVRGIFKSTENIFAAKDKVRIKANGTHISVCILGESAVKLFPERQGFRMEIPILLTAGQTKKVLFKITASDSSEELKRVENIPPDESSAQNIIPCEDLARKTAEAMLYDLIYGSDQKTDGHIPTLGKMPTIPNKPYAIIECDSSHEDMLRAYLNAFKILKSAGIDILIYLMHTELVSLIRLCEESGVESELYVNIFPTDFSLSEQALTAFKSGAFHIYPRAYEISNQQECVYEIVPSQSGNRLRKTGNELFGIEISGGVCEVYAYMLSRRVIAQNDVLLLKDNGKLYILEDGKNSYGNNRISQSTKVSGYSYSRTVQAASECDIIYLCEPFGSKDTAVTERIYLRKSPSGGEIYSSVDEGKIRVESSLKGELNIIRNALTKGRTYLAAKYHIKGNESFKLTISYTRNRNFKADSSLLAGKETLTSDSDRLRLSILRRCLTQFTEGDLLENAEWLSPKAFKGKRLCLTGSSIKLLEDTLEYLNKSGDGELLCKQVRYCAGITAEQGQGRVYLTAGFESVSEHLRRTADFSGDNGRKIYDKIVQQGKSNPAV